MRGAVRRKSGVRPPHGASAPLCALAAALLAVAALPGGARAEVTCVDAQGRFAVTNLDHCPEGFVPVDAPAGDDARRAEAARLQRQQQEARARELAAANAAEEARLREAAARKEREAAEARDRARREREADIAATDAERRRREAEAARSAAAKRTVQVVVFALALGIPAAWGLFLAVGMARRSRRRPELERQAREAAGALAAAMDELRAAPEYLAASDVAGWRERHEAAVGAPILEQAKELLAPDEARRVRGRTLEVKRLAATVAAVNRAFVARRVAEEAAAFDAAEPVALAGRQREAIVTNEDATLVVAGAGTGRAATIVHRVAYLTRRGLAQPGQVLVIASGKRDARALKDQLARAGVAPGVQIATFHSLGVQIVAEAAGAKPALSDMAEDAQARKGFIRDAVARMLASPDYRPLLADLLTDHLDEAPDPARPRTGSQAIAEERIRGLRAIDGTQLKSREEVQIANWLTLGGIAWEYERPYPHATDAAGGEGYRPDFYLPEHDLYLEHFAVDRNDNTAPQVDGDTYRRSMRWKRDLHQEHGTRLVETYSWQKSEGGLAAALGRVLAGAGVTPGRPSAETIGRIADLANRPFADLVNLVDHFLTLYKGGGAGFEAVQMKIRTPRDRVFVDLFKPILQEYEGELARTRQIDFNDMIALARGHVGAGRYRSPFTHIVVDELQDHSPGRLGLLLDLRAQVPGCRLFAVGDDWQSVYRFGGADVGIVLDLAAHAGAVERVDLDTSFRCPQELLDLTSAFVAANPAQLRKTLVAHRGASGGPAVVVVVSEASARAPGADGPLEAALAEIAGHAGGGPASVLVLGRYRFNQPANFDELAARFAGSGLELAWMTAHASKGTEADYVVIVDVEAGEVGFPANIADDPVLHMALTAREDFPYAEERRLFYVAMTRARRLVYLIVPAERASPFVREELFSEACEPFVRILGESAGRLLCPRCKGRSIRPSGGRRGAPYTCEDFPACDGRLEQCPDCGEGVLEFLAPDGEAPLFRCASCGSTRASCPKCKAGFLVEREGKHGQFLGCSRWKSQGGCEHFEKL